MWFLAYGSVILAMVTSAVVILLLAFRIVRVFGAGIEEVFEFEL